MDRREFILPNVPKSEVSRTRGDLKNFDPAQNAQSARSKITSTLAPWSPSASEPWNVNRIIHLYRRAGFGATPAEVSSGLSMSHASLIDSLLSDTHLSAAELPA